MQKNSWDGRKVQKELHGITGETINKVCNAEKVLSPDWSDLQMKIDGRLICLPSPYHEFVALGWDFRISDYDCDRYILLPGYNSDCIVLTNQEYIGNGRDDYCAHICVSLKNSGRVPTDIKKCDVHSVDVSRITEGRITKRYPSVFLSGGITWESTREDILIAYGKPDRSRTGHRDIGDYEVFTYIENHCRMELMMCDESLCGIRIQQEGVCAK